MLGTAVGDALGMPLEGMPHELIENSFGTVTQMIDGRLPAGHYTDDTQLMIGVAESLVENRGFVGEHMAMTFFNNFEAFRGYGYGTVRVLQHILDGMIWSEAAKHIFGGGSYGNGAAMRIAPVGLLYHADLERLVDVTRSASRITHTHSIGIEGAIVQVMAIARAVQIEPVPDLEIDGIEFIDHLISRSKEDEFIIRFRKSQELLMGGHRPSKDDLVYYLGNDVQAHKSIPLAVYCFLNNYHSFKDAVVCAVNMGGDTDTLGAMTGAIAGALHGASSIPKAWLDDLESNHKGVDHIRDLAEKLFNIYQPASALPPLP